jgi:hypothetical protein
MKDQDETKTRIATQEGENIWVRVEEGDRLWWQYKLVDFRNARKISRESVCHKVVFYGSRKNHVMRSTFYIIECRLRWKIYPSAEVGIRTAKLQNCW